MESSMDQAKMAANLYAKEFVEYIFRRHGIPCYSEEPAEFWNNISQVFNPEVGEIIVVCAAVNVRACRNCMRSLAVKLIRSYETFEIFCIYFRYQYFSTFIYSPDSIFMYFSLIMEQTISVFLEGIEEAPSVAAETIASFLMNIDNGRYVMRGGLNNLNDAAREMLRHPSLCVRFKFKEFAIWASAKRLLNPAA